VAEGADLTDKHSAIVTQSGDATVERIIQFIKSYNGGDFFIAPASVEQGRAVLERYGSSVLPFTIFEREFTRQTGLVALTKQHVVTRAQCAAVEFLYGLRNQGGSAPSLHINAEYVNSGTVLFGTTANFGDRTLQVLLVGADGNVQELSSLLKVSERNNHHSTSACSAFFGTDAAAVADCACQQSVHSRAEARCARGSTVVRAGAR
jgi:hypothetical protein